MENEDKELHAAYGKFRTETIEAIDRLAVFFQVENKADAIARAIKLADSVATEIDKGGKIQLVTPDGNRFELNFQ